MLEILAPALLGISDFCLKEHVEKNLSFSDKKEICGGNLQLRRYHNHGLIFDRLKERPQAVRALTVLAGILIGAEWLFTFLQKGQMLKKAGLSLLLAGAAGNLFDRLKRGYVVDYISFPKAPEKIRKIIFNISDFMIFTGAVLTMIASLWQKN